MIGDMVIKTGGSRGDDDSVSGIYATDGTAMVDPESQVSVSTGTADTPTTIVTANTSKSIFRTSNSLSNDDDSMSGMYTAYSASMTKKERFRASVLAEERKIRKEYSFESGSGSFESYPDSSFLPKTLIAAKTPSRDKKKNQKAKWFPFVDSVGTNDFDLDSIASDGIMEGGARFQVVGIKSMDASSPSRGTKEMRIPSTLGGAGVLSSSSSSDDASPDHVQPVYGHAGLSRGATETSSKAKREAAAAATSQMRPRVCGCRPELIICILASLVAIAIAVAVGAFIASNHMGDSIESDFASQNGFQAPTLSRPLALSAPTATPSLSTPAPSPLMLKSTKGPTNSPAVVVTETESLTGLHATPGPTNTPVFVVVTQRPTAVPVAMTTTLAPVDLAVAQSPATAQPTPACLLEDVVGQPFFVSLRVGMRNCTWLSQNPVFQLIMCIDGIEANDLCRATCNNCGPTSAPTTAPTATR